MAGLTCGNDGLKYAADKVVKFETWYIKNANYNTDDDRKTAQQLLNNKDYMAAVKAFGVVWWNSYKCHNCGGNPLDCALGGLSKDDVKKFEELLTPTDKIATWNEKWLSSGEYKTLTKFIMYQYALHIGWDIASYIGIQIVIAMIPGIKEWIKKQDWIPQPIKDFLIGAASNIGDNLQQIADNIKSQLKQALLQLAGQNKLLKQLLGGAFDSISGAVDSMAQALGKDLSDSLTNTLTGIVTSVTAMINQSKKENDITAKTQQRLIDNLARQGAQNAKITEDQYDKLHSNVLTLGSEWL